MERARSKVTHHISPGLSIISQEMQQTARLGEDGGMFSLSLSLSLSIAFAKLAA